MMTKNQRVSSGGGNPKTTNCMILTEHSGVIIEKNKHHIEHHSMNKYFIYFIKKLSTYVLRFSSNYVLPFGGYG